MSGRLSCLSHSLTGRGASRWGRVPCHNREAAGCLCGRIAPRACSVHIECMHALSSRAICGSNTAPWQVGIANHTSWVCSSGLTAASPHPRPPDLALHCSRSKVLLVVVLVVVLRSRAYNFQPLRPASCGCFCAVVCFQFELDAAADAQSLQAQLQAHFRSQNVIYALLVEGEPFTVWL